MSQISLFIHLLLLIWIINIIDRNGYPAIKKSRLHAWQKIVVYIVLAGINTCLLWWFCGYIINQFQ